MSDMLKQDLLQGQEVEMNPGASNNENVLLQDQDREPTIAQDTLHKHEAIGDDTLSRNWLGSRSLSAFQASAHNLGLKIEKLPSISRRTAIPATAILFLSTLTGLATARGKDVDESLTVHSATLKESRDQQDARAAIHLASISVPATPLFTPVRLPQVLPEDRSRGIPEDAFWHKTPNCRPAKPGEPFKTKSMKVERGGVYGMEPNDPILNDTRAFTVYGTNKGGMGVVTWRVPSMHWIKKASVRVVPCVENPVGAVSNYKVNRPEGNTNPVESARNAQIITFSLNGKRVFTKKLPFYAIPENTG